MSRSTRQALALAALLLCAAARPAAADDLAARLAAGAGDDALLVGLVPELGALLKKADRLGEPFSAQVSAMFPLFAPNLFRSSQAAQLDLAQPLSFVLVRPQKHSTAFAYAGTARDPAAFLGGLGQAGASEGGITEYSGAAGTLYGAPSGQQQVLVSDSRELLARVLAARPAPELLPEVAGDVRIRVPVARLLRLYAADIARTRARMLSSLAQAPSQQGLDPKAMAAMYSAYLDMLQQLGAQLESTGVGIGLEGGDLLVRNTLHPLAGSKLEGYLRAQGPPEGDLLAGLPKDGVLLMGAYLKTTPELMDAYMAMLDILTAGDARLPAPLRQRIAELLHGFGPRYGAVLLAGDASQATMRMVQYFDHTQPEQFGPTAAEILQPLAAAIEKLYADLGMGLSFEIGPAEDAGLPAGTYRTSMTFKDLPAEQKPIFEAMYGGTSVASYFVPVPGRIVFTMGPDAAELAAEWTQRLSAAALPPSGRELPAEPGGTAPVFVMLIDLAGYARTILAAMPAEARSVLERPVQAFQQTAQEMSVLGFVRGPVAELVTRYPLEKTLQAVKAAQNR
jgi:hypothetical protein